jgi:hypothetical protein
VLARGKRLQKDGRDDCIQSERAAHIYRHQWLARSSSDQVQKTPAQLGKSKLDEICDHLDELSSHWSGLDVGESVAVSWPDLAIVDSGR